MTASNDIAVVGPDGTLVLPSGLRQRRDLSPGARLRIVERDDGVLELHASDAPGDDPDLGAFWERWWGEAAVSDARASAPERTSTTERTS